MSDEMDLDEELKHLHHDHGFDNRAVALNLNGYVEEDEETGQIGVHIRFLPDGVDIDTLTEEEEEQYVVAPQVHVILNQNFMPESLLLHSIFTGSEFGKMLIHYLNMYREDNPRTPAEQAAWDQKKAAALQVIKDQSREAPTPENTVKFENVAQVEMAEDIPDVIKEMIKSILDQHSDGGTEVHVVHLHNPNQSPPDFTPFK